MSDQPVPIRVLSIAHTAVEHAAGRLRYQPFARRSDFDIELIVPQRWRQFGRVIDADPPVDPALKVRVMPILLSHLGPFSWYLHVYPGLRREIRRLQPQVIHLWEEPWSLVALQAVLMRGKAGIVLEVDQNILKRLPQPFEAIRRFVLKRTAHVLSRSPDATSVVRACGYAGPVSEIGYGVDDKTFRPDGPRPAVDPQALRLGYVGRLVEEKGLDDELEAMALAGPGVTLSIIGEGPHQAKLMARITELGLEGRVSILPWSTPDKVAAFIRGLDALVLLTRTTPVVKEQFGRVIIEAQACGVPVIGSTCGAIPSVIADGGWVVPEGDPQALADVIAAMRADPSSVAEKGRRAQENVVARFSYDAVAEQLAVGWRSALSRRA